MKIKFFLSNNELLPTTISDKLFANVLKERSYDVEIVNDYKRKKEILDKLDADMIIFQKKKNLGHRYEDIYRVKGKIFLCHIDDDFSGANVEQYRKTLEISDLILVGNQTHAEELAKYISTPIEVITSISDFQNYPYISTNKKKNNPIIISWQQNLADDYVEDLRSISEVLNKIYNKYKIELRLYGWDEGKNYGIPDKRDEVKKFLRFAKFIPLKPFNLYLSEIVPDISRSDIGIIPYLNIQERCGKSCYSMRRMMMMGIPLVASDVGGNKYVIEDGVTGFLANEADEWYEKLEKLILQEDLREKISMNARKFVENEFAYEKTVDKFINAIKKYYPI